MAVLTKRQGLSVPIPTRTTAGGLTKDKNAQTPVAKRYKLSQAIGHVETEDDEETSYTGRAQTQEPQKEKRDMANLEEHTEDSEYVEESESDLESEVSENEVAHLNHGHFEPSLKSWLMFMKLQLVEDIPAGNIYDGLAAAISAKSVSSGSRVISGDALKIAFGDIDSDATMGLRKMETILTSFSKATGFTVLSVLVNGENHISKVSRLVRIQKERVDMASWGNRGWSGFFQKEISWILLIATTVDVGSDLQIRKFYSARYMEKTQFAKSHLTAGDNDCFLGLLGALGYYEPLLLYKKDFIIRSDEKSEMDYAFPAKVLCGRGQNDWIEKVAALHKKILRAGCYQVLQVDEEVYKLFFLIKGGPLRRHHQGFFTIAEMAFYLWNLKGEDAFQSIDPVRVFGKTTMKLPLQTNQALCRQRDVILQEAKLESIDDVTIARDKQNRIAAMNKCKNTMALLIAYAFNESWQSTIQLKIPASTLKQMREEINVHQSKWIYKSCGVYCYRKPSGKIVAPNANDLFQKVWDEFGSAWVYSVGLSAANKVHSSQPGIIRIGIPTKEVELMKSMVLFQAHSLAHDKVCARIDGRITFVGDTQLEVCGKIWRELGSSWPDVIGLNTTKSKRAGRKKIRYIVEEISDDT